MVSLANVVLPALITLIGTLVAVLIGYRQWRQQHRADAQTRFLKARRAAYRQIWDLLVRFNSSIRFANGLDDAALAPTLYSEILEQLQASAIYLDEPDRILILTYVTKLVRLNAIVFKLGKDEIANSLEAFDDLTQMGMLVEKNGIASTAIILLGFELPMELLVRLLGDIPAPQSIEDLSRAFRRRPLALFPLLWIIIALLIYYAVTKMWKGSESTEQSILALQNLIMDRHLYSRWKAYLATKRKLIRRFRSVLRES